MFFKNKKTEIAEAPPAAAFNIPDIVDYLSDGIMVIDNNRRISFLNIGIEKIFGIKRDELIFQHVSKLEDYPGGPMILSFLGTEPDQAFKKEIQIREDLVVEASAIPMENKGKKIGTLVALHDITQAKEAQKIKSEFVTVAAHQLRTPASVVKWTIGMLLEGDVGPLSMPQAESLKKAYDTNEKIIALINQLLSVAKSEEGGFSGKFTLTSVEDLINYSVSLHADMATQKRIMLKSKLPEDEKLPKVMIDLEKIKIALNILVENALMYNFPGGEVIVSGEKKDREVEIQVQDTGAGIPEQEQQNVFGKFYRASNALKIHTEGTGLGLSIAKNIIESHNGRIWFRSKEGKGTIFYFTLPVKQKYAEFVDKRFY